MGHVDKAKLRGHLQALASGAIDFDGYLDRLGDHPPSLQLQLRCALDQRKAARWDEETYQILKWELQSEFDPDFNGHRPAMVHTQVFNPWSSAVRNIALPPGWTWSEQHGKYIPLDGSTSHVMPTAQGVKGPGKVKITDPVRTTSGRFKPFCAEVWYISEQGVLRRSVFLSRFAEDGEGNPILDQCLYDGIQAAFQKAADAQAYWTAAGCRECVALVKFRRGDTKGNKNILLVTAGGMILPPAVVVKWHAEARQAGLKAKVGEKVCRTKQKHVLAMLAQNATFGEVMVDLRAVDIPIVEPEDPNEIVYSIMFQSGARRTVVTTPVSDQKDEDGKVKTAGHKVRAYRLLLECPASDADSPKSIKYVDPEGRLHVLSRGEALLWDEEQEEEDEGLVALHKAFLDRDLSDEEYIMRRARRLDEIDPPDVNRRKGPAMYQPKIRIEYGSDGRMVWQRARNTSGPGSRWISGQSAFEAMLYNMS